MKNAFSADISVITESDKLLTCMYAHTTHRAADELASSVFLHIRGGQVSFRAAGETHLWNQRLGPPFVSFSCRTALAQADYFTLYERNVHSTVLQ